jgi:hypothetical protein
MLLIGGFMDVREQFLTKITWEEDKDTECWIPNKSSGNGENYSTTGFYINGKTKWFSLHRLSYIVFNGPIPDGHCVMHKCDNKKCINPWHLSTGTNNDNTQDMIRKGRICRIGLEQKLTRKDIIEIRGSELSSYQLAKIYPVSATHIRRIKRGDRCAGIK